MVADINPGLGGQVTLVTHGFEETEILVSPEPFHAVSLHLQGDGEERRSYHLGSEEALQLAEQLVAAARLAGELPR